MLKINKNKPILNFYLHLSYFLLLGMITINTKQFKDVIANLKNFTKEQNIRNELFQYFQIPSTGLIAGF